MASQRHPISPPAVLYEESEVPPGMTLREYRYRARSRRRPLRQRVRRRLRGA